MKSKIIISIISVLLVGGIWFYYSNQKSAWNATFMWTGISELPSWAQNQKIETTGTMFTRTFFVSFTGTPAEIDDWLKTEPALQNIQPEKVDENIYKYILKPKGGSSYDEVKIDRLKGEVIIRASSS